MPIGMQSIALLTLGIFLIQEIVFVSLFYIDGNVLHYRTYKNDVSFEVKIGIRTLKYRTKRNLFK